MIYPVLLCGGSGTRLWPLSRKSYPKQFVSLLGEESLFQAAARRLSGPGYAPPLTVTGSEFRFIVTEQLAGAGIDPGPILLEPEARNTAPAVLAAALWLTEVGPAAYPAADPGALMLIAPADHAIPDAAAFRAAVAAGRPAAEAGRIVAFGIRPDRPETGFGWLELAEAPEDGAPGDGVPLPLRAFVEKPDPARALDLLAAGNCLWNAGIFLVRAATILEAFAAHAPGLVAPVRAALAGAKPDLGFLRLDPGPWAEVEAISIDHAVMERAGNLAVVPYAAGWSDLGGWDAVWREMGAGPDGVTASPSALAIDCRDTLLRSEAEGLELVGIGLDGIIAVAMPDAVLVAARSRAQEVGRAVAALRDRGVRQAESFALTHRPWGWYETLAAGDRFQVKRIVVHPGAALSLQSHLHRSEHWIVVTGTARVTLDGTVTLVSEGQSIHIPLGLRHRLENPGKLAMVLIEVQTGAYLGEDDIIRHADAYARGPSG